MRTESRKTGLLCGTLALCVVAVSCSEPTYVELFNNTGGVVRVEGFGGATVEIEPASAATFHGLTYGPVYVKLQTHGVRLTYRGVPPPEEYFERYRLLHSRIRFQLDPDDKVLAVLPSRSFPETTSFSQPADFRCSRPRMSLSREPVICRPAV